MTRDPRADPQPGDELVMLRGGAEPTRWWRQVESRSIGGVTYSTNMGKSKWQPLYRWREQVKNWSVQAMGKVAPHD